MGARVAVGASMVGVDGTGDRVGGVVGCDVGVGVEHPASRTKQAVKNRFKDLFIIPPGDGKRTSPFYRRFRGLIGSAFLCIESCFDEDRFCELIQIVDAARCSGGKGVVGQHKVVQLVTIFHTR